MARYQPPQTSSLEHGAWEIQSLDVPASQIAERIGTVRVANLVALGAYVGATHLVSHMSIETALTKIIPDSRKDLRAPNMIAFQEGSKSIDRPVKLIEP